VLHRSGGSRLALARCDMKSIIQPLVAMALGSVLLASATSADDCIPWACDFRTACELAAEQHRLVLLHFYNDDCEPCRRLERNVFSVPRVGEAVAQNYIPVKIHAGKDPRIANRYQVVRWPTDVIVTPSGLEVFRAISPQKPADYITLVDQVAQQTGVGAMRQWHSPLDQVARRSSVRTAGAANPIHSAIATERNNVAVQTQPWRGALHQFQTGSNEAGAVSSQIANHAPTAPESRSRQATQVSQPYVLNAGDTFRQFRQHDWTPRPSGLRSPFVPADVPASSELSIPAGPPLNAAVHRSEAAAPASEQLLTTIDPPLPIENPWFTAAARQPADSALPDVSPSPSLPFEPARPQEVLRNQRLLPEQPAIAEQPPTVQPPPTVQQPQIVEQPQIAEQPAGSQPEITEQQRIAERRADAAERWLASPQVSPAAPSLSSQVLPVPALQAGGPSTPQVAVPDEPAVQSRIPQPAESIAHSPGDVAPQPVLASQAPPIALDGFCAVTLVQSLKWQKGEREFGAVHRGRTYLFVSAAEQRKFLMNPDGYAPVLSGYDAVRYAEHGVLVEGKRAYGLITDDQRVFLFADEASLNKFRQSPTGYRTAAYQAMLRTETGTMYR
jgi:YHS domain-containing protein/thiol-disulfide isomerase/thioredoxin